MAEIVHNTSYEMKGPWLIDCEQLLELDKIIKQRWESLLGYRERKIDEEVESEINKYNEDRQIVRQRIEKSYNYEIKKNLTIFNSDGTQIKTSDFASMIQHPDIEARIVKGFSYSIQCSGIECDLTLRSYDLDITLDVRPGTIEEARELFVAIKRWINRVKAPLWQRIARGWFYGMWWLVLLFILIFSVQIFEKKTSPEWQQMKHAHDLLKNGIDDNNTRDYLATTLAIISEYEKPKSSTGLSFPNWYIFLLIAIFLICLILMILPKKVIGIGKGEQSIIWWRRWLRLVSYTIPIVIFSSFVWPWIVDWVKSIF